MFGCFKKSVASITASLTSMVNELEAHAQAMREEQQRHLDAAAKFHAKAELAELEVAAAARVKDKLASLFA